MGEDFAERLVRRYSDRVKAYVAFSVPGPDVEDVAAEVFLRALQKSSQVDSGDPGPWLFSIARSRVADYHRRKATDRKAMSRIAPASVEAPRALDDLETEEFRALLLEKVKLLSDAERDVIALKFTEGLSNIEIARTLEVTPNHLGVMLHRALSKLRDAMKGAGG